MAAQPDQCYLVTGAIGFIGFRVSQQLLDAGHRVVGVDNLNDAYDPRLKRWRLGQLQQHTHFDFEEIDVANRDRLTARFATDVGQAPPAVNAIPYAAVINLAARAGVRPSVENPQVYLDTNITGTLNLLECCRQFGVKKFVLASTSSAYGDTEIPFREDARTDGPLSPYAASKKAAEVLTYTYHRLHKIDATVLRYFTVYGPAGRPDMSVFRFIRQIALGETLTVFGDGSQQRDFTYVDDVAAGTIAALKPLGYEIINLGGDRPATLTHVIELISQLVGRKPIINYRPPHPADVPATWADIAKARELLGWSPKTSLEEGLAQAVGWFQKNRALAQSINLS